MYVATLIIMTIAAGIIIYCHSCQPDEWSVKASNKSFSGMYRVELSATSVLLKQAGYKLPTFAHLQTINSIGYCEQ